LLLENPGKLVIREIVFIKTKDHCISGGKKKEGKRIRSGKKKEIWYNGGDEE